jgi:hypothetical protein
MIEVIKEYFINWWNLEQVGLLTGAESLVMVSVVLTLIIVSCSVPKIRNWFF